MNRTDRLVAMVMHLQGRRVVRAEELATHFEISLRTVYRDIGALSEAGVPVTGEAGVGYSLVKGYHLPPVMFTAEEAMALFVGGEMVKHFTDASLAAPMQTALLKIRSVLPRERQDDVDRLAQATAIGSRPSSDGQLDQRVLLPIQQAIVTRRVLRLEYRAVGRLEDTAREVEPLGITFYGGSWYLIAWCRLRSDIRHFKLTRLRKLDLLGERFRPRPEFSLREHIEATMEQSEMFPARIRFSHLVVERARRESIGDIEIEASDDSGITVRMRTFSYLWLARWIMSFGGEAVVLEPEAVRENVRELTARVAELHEAHSLLT